MMASDGSRYDAVVVGGGHNGLVCAAYLSRAGMKTVVLERRHLVGGAAVTEEVWPGFGVSTASYVVSLMSDVVIRELDLPRYGYHVYPLDPAYFAPFPDGSGFLLWDDPVRAAEEIGRINARDGKAYLEYSRELGELADLVRPLLYRRPPDPGVRSLTDLAEALYLGRYAFGNRRSIARLVDLMTMSCADFLDRFFVDERVKGALAPGGVIGMWGGPMSPGSAYVLLHHRMGEIDGVTGGWGFVRGGMGGVSEAIAASARAAGAEIRTNAEVAAIDVAGGRTTGVTLADGTSIESEMVVSGAHPQTTLLSLLGAQHLPNELVREVGTFRNRSPSAKVNLALSELPDLTAMPGKELGPQHPEIMISPSLEYLEKAWDDAKYGRFSEAPMIDAVIPTTKDSTIAPEGRHIMTCFVQYAPYEPREGSWDGGAREALGDTVVDTIGEYAPNFRDSVIERQVLTPYDLEQRFGLIGGNIFQGEMSLDQLFSFRPTTELAGYKTPVDGLYLCGSGSHPGGGVMGIPGLNASKVVISDHKRAERKRRLKERLTSYSRR
jgi:phytoene dehydrogenase-like protein